MADDKPEKSEEAAADEALVKRVDEMMDPARRNPSPAPPQGPYQPKKAPVTGAPPVEGVYKPKDSGKPPIIIKLETDEKQPPAQPEVPAVPPSEKAAAKLEEPAHDPAGSALSDDTPLDDEQTDEAVDDIAAEESDTILAVEDAKAARKARALNAQKPGWKSRLKALPKNKWTWAVLALVLAVIFALPFTRYPILGLVLKKPVDITVVDSKTGTPVSSAWVRLGSASAKTDADGQARLRAPVGKQTLKITKQYYSDFTASYFVGFKAPSQPLKEKLAATGRLVPISVVNKISGKPLQGAEIKIKGTTAKTNSKGQASVALPASSSTDTAAISLNGYNTANVAVQVTNQTVKANQFQLTPAGQVYFLSNASGTIDVIKTNLDGSGRNTVFAGTGKEDPTNTTLLASRDWRYLVLESSRDGGKPALYLIDTSNDKVTEFENSGADITLVGWYGHDFIYELTKSSMSYWQTGREALKSYDADHQQLNQLDQSLAEGSATSYAYQDFENFYIDNGLVVYSTQWQTFDASSMPYNTTGKNDTIRAVQPNGQNKKDYQNFPVASTGYIQAQPYSPTGIYFSVYDNSQGLTTYYSYQNQSVSTASINNGTFAASYPTYLVSPSGSQTFWTQLVDGQDTLFIGGSDASNKKQIEAGSYKPYGWYTNSYVLVSKGNSQLYIMPSSGLNDGQPPLKITDYYKPAQTFAGYGYGYGGY